ncbi:MAG: F0F1 ATP synthase subunit delta [Treponema sp.]|nr:F0F1 ATP synthase subunit delta [Treponema sp.]
MFRGNCWAVAFVGALGAEAAAGLACLQAMVGPVKSIAGAAFGYRNSRRLEKLLRESAGTSDTACEYAIRFITLLLEKNVFKYVDAIIRNIEALINAQNGILAVTVESAEPLDADFENALREKILERTGAVRITMNTLLVPELLGGYVLRIGGFYIDASLKGQIEKMAVALRAGI